MLSSRHAALGRYVGARKRRKGITHPSDITRATGPGHPSDRSRIENFGAVRPPQAPSIQALLADPAIRLELMRRRKQPVRSGNRGKGLI